MKITDTHTGMQITLAGDTAPTEEEMPEVFYQAQRQAEDLLRTGEYKYSGMEKLDKPAQRARMSRIASVAMGVAPDSLDVDSGMGSWGRLKIGLQPTVQDKMKHLESTYGKENVRGVEIDGDIAMFYRDVEETSGKFRIVNEQGLSLGDITSFVAGEALPVGTAIAGAVKGAAAGLPLGPGGMIAGGAAGAAAGYMGASTAQDIAVRTASGEDVAIGEILPRRGLETAIGIPIDLVTGYSGRVLTKFISKRMINKAAADLTKNVDAIAAKYGVEPDLTAAQMADPDASLQQSIRAGLSPSGREANVYAKQRDEIFKVARALRGEAPLDEPFENVVDKLAKAHLETLDKYKKKIDQLTSQAEMAGKVETSQIKAARIKINKKLKAQLKLEHEARVARAGEAIEKLVKGRSRLEHVRGDNLRKQVEAGLKTTKAKSNELYEEAYRLTDTPNANTPVSAVKAVLDKIDDATLPVDSPQFLPDALSALKLLRTRIAENPQDLTFRELDTYIRQITERIKHDKKYGWKIQEQNLRDMGRQLDKLVDKAMSRPKALGGRGAGAQAKKAHMAARSHYRNRVLPYFDDDRAAILKRVVGGSRPAMDGKDVVNRMVSTHTSVKDAIKAGASREELKNAYLQKIVSGRGAGVIKYDKNILDALYSTTPGRYTSLVKNIDEVNRIIRESKNGTSAVDPQHVHDLLEAFEPKARAKKLRALRIKERVQSGYDKARGSFLGRVIRGEVPPPEDLHIIVKDIANLRPGQIARLFERLSRLSPKEADSLRRSGIELFLEEAGERSVGAQRASSILGKESLWEPDKMYKMLSNSASRSKWEALLGKDVVDDYAKINEWLASSAEIRETTAEGIGRFVTSTGASGVPNLLFVSPQLPRWIGRKILGIIHTAPLSKTMLRRHLMEKTFDQEVFERLFFTGMGTEKGLRATSDEMSKDPAFSMWMEEVLRQREPQN